jgi:hypothetical protein
MTTEIPTYPGVTFTRDAGGIATINAPNVQLGYEAYGYL